MVSNPLSVLWIGRATIYEYVNEFDSDTWQTKQKLLPVVEDEPCRISFRQETTTEPVMGASKLIKVTMLFIRPDLEIKPGSIIEVTQRGKTAKYKRSSDPAIYTNHQEVVLELYEEHA